MRYEDIRKSVSAYLDRTGYAAMDLKYAMFDMDGVLFDSMPYHAKTWVQVMAEAGIPFSEDDAYINEGRKGVATIELAVKRMSMPEMTKDEIQAIYDEKCELFNACGEAGPMNGTLQLVKSLESHGVRMTVVTGSAQQSLLRRIESAYPSLFELDKMVTANDVVHGKPDPEPYLTGLHKMNAKQWEAVVVENAPLGALAGRAAGVFTVVVNTGPLPDATLRDSGADLLFHDMDEFRDSLATLFEVIRNTVNENGRK